MATESDRLRIAVALTALRFKPIDQSLMETFASESGNAPGSSLPAPNSSLEKPTVCKKKLKKKPGPNMISCFENTMRKELVIPRPDLKAILQDLSFQTEEDIAISWGKSQQSLFSTLDSFMQLTALPEARLDLLSSVTLRTVKAIAKQINDVISPLVISSSSDSNSLHCLGTTLHYVLATSLPSLEQALPETAETIIAIVDRTTTLILLPIVRAFNARSEAFFGSLFLPRPAGGPDEVLQQSASCHPSSSTDIRVNMLEIFKTTFCSLDRRLRSFTTLIDPSLVSHTFRASLILDTLREIDAVLSMAVTSHNPESGVEMNDRRYQRTRPDRVKRLAKKDSLWYLCTALHVLLCEPSAAASQPETLSAGRKYAQKESPDNLQGARLLSEGILDALLQLITRCHRPLSSSVQLQKPGVDLDERLRRARSGPTLKCMRLQGGLECAIEGSTTAGLQGGTDGNIDNCMLGENRGGDGDVVINATKQHRNEDRSIDLLPQEAKSHNPGHDIELDEVGYGMLLGVLERYWVWSRSWEI
ncbi:hypothetical protein C0992_011271 [Termitomyces sp. T32_za158]|nr:hypothetical protein C0992_011271 [Termitomyces sp. T32_za158]